VCNDGSSDNTKIIAEEMGCIVINHTKNQVYGSAIRSLFNKAKEKNYDVLVTFDSDGQHYIDDIKNVLKLIIEDKADIVIGSRLIDNAENEIPKYRKIGIKKITKLTTLSSNKNIKDSQSGFRAYNTKCLEKIKPSESGMEVSTEILIKADRENLRILEIPIKISYEGGNIYTQSCKSWIISCFEYNEIYFNRESFKILWNTWFHFSHYRIVFHSMDLTRVYNIKKNCYKYCHNSSWSNDYRYHIHDDFNNSLFSCKYNQRTT
jgi:glycosyltransferase involved in cell wall biosynthesis